MSELLTSRYEIQHQSEATFALTDELRKKADTVLETVEFPTTRNEAWKYTRVAKIKNTTFQILDKRHETKDVSHYFIPNLSGSRLVFVNGFFSKELSTIQQESGIEISSIKHSQSIQNEIVGKLVPLEGELFNAMNTFYAQDGVSIRIAKNTQSTQSIQVVFVSSGENVFSGVRNVITCEDFAKAHITFNFVSENAGISTPLNVQPSFTNCISEIHVGTNAHLTIDKIQQEDETNFNMLSEFVDQAKDSTFTINTITLDGGLVRNNLSINVNGQNCETNLSGAYILKGKQHVDNHTTVDHKVAHCQSNELYKGVIDEQATAVFNGKVFVRKDAQKINAFQSNGNVLLSDSATVNSKPELEIYADDVKCSHGSTTGQLDEEAVFYLRARGLSENSARALMVSAFIGDVIEKIENEAVQDYINSLIEEKFGWVK